MKIRITALCAALMMVLSCGNREVTLGEGQTRQLKGDYENFILQGEFLWYRNISLKD